MKLRITCAALACTLLLAGCAAGEGTAVSSSAEPSVSTTAEPAITPEPTAEPTPEPTPAPTPNPASLLEYTMLPLDSTKETPANFWWYSMSLRDDTAKENAHRLAMGLYSNDVDEVRAACSERVLTDTFPLDDLDGLNVTEAALYGGEYDSPFLSLTVTDPGNTPFLCGRHEYYLSFDADGKVDWLGRSPLYEDTQSVTLASYYESPSEDVSFWGITSAELTNPLGLTWGPASLQCYDAYWVPNEEDDGHHYENRNEQDLGPVDAPPYGITSYDVPPEGNSLTGSQLENVCEALNKRFSALADGSYMGEFDASPGNDALLSAWDAAVPLPVSVTPEALRSRSEEDTIGTTYTDIWIPLPENCWAVVSVYSDFSDASSVEFLYAFRYYQSIPTTLAAVLPQ